MAIQITNQATITYQSGRDEKSATSNLATTTLEGPFSVSKTSLSNVYGQTSDITYILTTTNNSQVALTNVRITDDLGKRNLTNAPLTYTGPALLYINGVLDNSLNISQTSSGVIFTIPTLAANAHAIIVYRAKPNRYAPLGLNGSITNSASWTADLISDTTSDSNTITVANHASVSIVKSMNPDPVTSGSTLTYTFNLTNTGNIAATHVVLTDTFNPAPMNIVVHVDGHTLPATSYTYENGLLTINDLTVPSASFTTAKDGSVTTHPGTSTITVAGII